MEREIYRLAFGTDPDFENDLFYSCNSCLKALKANGKTVSILFFLPCEIKSKTATFPAFYIFAAATHPEKRKKGYMEMLLKEALKDNCCYILRPSSEDLVKYYEKFGFKKFTATDSGNPELFMTPTGDFSRLASKTEKTNEGCLTLMCYGAPEDLTGLSFPFTMP